MPAPARTTDGHAVRTDIQGLRAIAVSLVLVYHLAPTTLTGGFTGVDVFFVISGFLITLHLLGRPPGSARDLATFWSRRVRRLLPASLLVLAVTLVAARLIAPETQWSATARQTGAAALYVVNWVLAGDAVDYLAADSAATTVQHFWSLSVEEQFYFGWPILIGLAAFVARRLRRDPIRVAAVGLAVAVVASFVWSVHLTSTNPAAAYFVTPTRVWELGVGGVLAAATLLSDRRPPRWAATSVAWLGLAAIAWTALTYTGETPFPGWQAALPVLGTAAVIAARPGAGDGRLAPGPLLALRPVQYLGDISYSVYLWHWPLVVLVPYATEHALTWPERLGIVVVTLVLAALTKTWVEDRFRTSQWGIPLRKPFVLAAGGMAIVVGLSGLQLLEVDHRRDDARRELAAAVAGDNPCFGAAALTPGRSCDPVAYDDIVPAPVDAAEDKSDAYHKRKRGGDCWSYLSKFPVKRCTFGDRSSDTEVVLVGNSHAGQWLPALQAIAKVDNLRIVTLVASQCASADLRQQFATTAQATACLRWVHDVTAKVVEIDPDLVVFTNRISVRAENHSLADSYPLYGDGYRSVLQTWQDAGIPVLAIRDTPAPGFSVPDCIAQHEASYAADCDGTRETWLPSEPVGDVVRELADPEITYADLTDHICEPEACHAVTGGVVTYFDASHLTATYAATLAPYLRPYVLAALGR